MSRQYETHFECIISCVVVPETVNGGMLDRVAKRAGIAISMWLRVRNTNTNLDEKAIIHRERSSANTILLHRALLPLGYARLRRRPAERAEFFTGARGLPKHFF